MQHPREATTYRTRTGPGRATHPATEVTRRELDGQAAELLPRRDTLCAIGCVNVNTVVAVNLAFAINAATAHSTANALAAQYLVALH